MRFPEPRAAMLAQAVNVLEAADRLGRQFFQIGLQSQPPCWEPPIDMIVSEREVGLLIALPGVAPERFEVTLEQQTLVVHGERSFGAGLGVGAVHRMEIPYGHFERRIVLPPGNFRLAEILLEHGCLKLTLERLSA